MNNIEELITQTNINQAIAADPNKSIWASANAGAGKTKVLIDRIARLLLSGAEPDKILAVTYTKAAAAEMTNRLFATLGEWAVESDDSLKKRLIKLDANLRFDNEGETLTKARALFAKALETPGGLKIQTIHAFCGSVLKRFPIEANIAPGFEVIEDNKGQILQELAFENCLRKDKKLFLKISNLSGLENLFERLIMLGSFMENKSLDNIIEKLKKFFGIVKIIDFDEAMNEAAQLIDENLLKECANILREGAKTDKDTASAILQILSEEKSKRPIAIINNIILTQSGTIRKKPPVTAKYADYSQIIKLFGSKDTWPSGEIGLIWDKVEKAQKSKIIQDTLDLIKAATLFYNQYSLLKNQMALLDFGDLLKKTSQLLNNPNNSALWVLYKLDQGLSHVLIDESQDTSAEQWELLNPLMEALEEGSSDFARTRFIVGDEKQSIYSFQGASPERFLFEQENFNSKDEISDVKFENVDFKVSFRTGGEILKAVDKVWEHSNKSSIETKSIKPSSHDSARQKESASVELWPIEMGIEANEEEEEAYNQPIDAILESSPKNQLAENIAKELKARIGKEPVWDKDKDGNSILRPLEAKDVMILVKARNDFFHQIIKRLKYYNIDVAGSDLIILNKDPAILDLIALGRFALRPEDDFNLACVLRGAFCNLYDDDNHLFPLAYKRKFSLWESLKNAENETFQNAKQFLLNALDKASKNPFEFFSYILENTHPCGKTGWELLINRLGNDVKESIETFIDISLKAHSNHIGHLGAFLDYIEYEAGSQKRDFDQNDNGVKVMTVHASKGREAKVVILPDTTRAVGGKASGLYFDSEKQFPIWVANPLFDIDEVEALKEERKAKSKQEDNRLLYVAMTRARDRLILCGYKYKNSFAKDSWYKDIEEALEKSDGLSEKELNSGIKAQIWGKIEGEITQLETKAAIEKEILPDWLFNEPREFSPPPRLIAPSALIENAEEPPVISPLKAKIKSRYLRGSLIHNLLELLPQIALERRAAFAKSWAQKQNIDKDLKEDIATSALKIVNDEQFKDIFSEKSRAEVAVIGKGQGLPENMVINGTIDRLVINENEVLILDYKTNRPPPSDLANVPQIYLNQMAAYRAVLQETYPDHKIKCILLWTDIPLMMELPNNLLDNALEKISFN